METHGVFLTIVDNADSLLPAMLDCNYPSNERFHFKMDSKCSHIDYKCQSTFRVSHS